MSPWLAHPPSAPFTVFSCFLSLVPPVHHDLSCIPCRPMSVSAAATALYKSLLWQPAAPCLSSVISPPPGDAHSLWQAFTLCVQMWDKIRFSYLLCADVFLVNILFAWERLFTAFSRKNATARRVALSDHDSQVFVWVGQRKWIVVCVIGWFETP